MGRMTADQREYIVPPSPVGRVGGVSDGACVIETRNTQSAMGVATEGTRTRHGFVWQGTPSVAFAAPFNPPPHSPLLGRG